MKKKVRALVVLVLVAMVAVGCGPDTGTPSGPEVRNLQGYIGSQCIPGDPLEGMVGRCWTPSACVVGQIWCRGQIGSAYSWVCADPPEGTVCRPDAGPVPALDGSAPVDASPDAPPATDAGPVPTDTTSVTDAGPPVDAGSACENGVGACRRSGVWRVNQHGNRECIGAPGTPSAEICDGIDNNCNGRVDDGITCVCRIGAMRACYTGPAITRDVGACHDGQQRCEGTAPTMWGVCDGQRVPVPEIPGNGRDDDCDGQTDEL